MNNSPARKSSKYLWIISGTLFAVAYAIDYFLAFNYISAGFLVFFLNFFFAILALFFGIKVDLLLFSTSSFVAGILFCFLIGAIVGFIAKKTRVRIIVTVSVLVLLIAIIGGLWVWFRECSSKSVTQLSRESNFAREEVRPLLVSLRQKIGKSWRILSLHKLESNKAEIKVGAKCGSIAPDTTYEGVKRGTEWDIKQTSPFILY